MSVRISTPRMTTEPSIRLWEERIFGLIISLTGLLTVLMAPRPSRELPPPQVPANWAVLRILAQSPFFQDGKHLCGARFAWFRAPFGTLHRQRFGTIELPLSSFEAGRPAH